MSQTAGTKGTSPSAKCIKSAPFDQSFKNVPNDYPRGLPCPNLSTGGYCYHGVNEFVPVSSLVKMTDVLQELVARFA